MKKHYLLILLPLLIFSISFAQNPPQWKCFSAMTYVKDMRFDGDYIWLAAEGGVMKYNKKTETKEFYNQANSGISYNFSTSLHIDPDHSVWIGSYLHTISHFKNSVWAIKNDHTMASGNASFSPLLINDTTIWSYDIIGGSPNSQTYLYRFNKNTFPIIQDSIAFPGVEGVSVPSSITLDTFGNVWACVDTGIYKYEGNNWTYLPASQNFGQIFIDKKTNTLYCIKNYKDIYRYDGNSFTQILSSNAEITLLNEDENRNHWIYSNGSGQELYYLFDGNTFTPYPSTFFPIILGSIHIDSLQHLWICGGSDSLFEYNGTNWIPYDIGNGNHLKSCDINGIAVNSQNEIFLNDYVISSFNGVSATPLTTQPYSINDATFDINDNYWCVSASQTNPVSRFDGQNWTHYNLPNGGGASHITIDKNNVPYITTQSGLMRFNGTNWQEILPNAYLNHSLYDIESDGNNNIYFSDLSGNIGRYNGTSIDYIYLGGVNNYLPPTLYVDNYNYVWALTATHFQKYDGQNWTLYNYTDVFNVSDIRQDNQGFYWLMTNKGFIRTDWNTDTTIFNFADNPIFFPYSMEIDHANNKWISSWNGLFVFNENGIFTSPFTEPFHKISGKIYGDNNQNGAMNTAEVGLVSQKVFLTPANVILYSNANGDYGFYADSGHYQLNFIPYNNNWVLSSDSSTYHPFVDTMDINGLDFGTYPSVSMDSFSIEILPTLPTCFSNIPIWVNYKNWGTNTRDGAIYFVTDSNFTFLNANPLSSSQNGDTLFWSFANLQPLEARSIMLEYHTPGPVVGQAWNGLNFSYKAGLTYLNGNSSIPFCNATYLDTVSCAYDPNDKSCKTYSNISADSAFYGDLLLYKIRFQNTGNAAAQNIVITDTLDSNLIDLNSFEFLGASHPALVQMQSNGIVQFTFENIMLPDSGADEVGSHGLLAYYVRSVANAPSNVSNQLNNSAAIYFDLNPPIITNTTHTYLMFKTDIEEDIKYTALKVIPNPFNAFTKISFENKENGIYQIFIYDLSGKLCYQSSTQKDFFEINGENFRQGMYIFHIQGEKHHYSAKFVKE